MMQFRKAKFNQFGSIDCEILSDDFGWIPYTATGDDLYSVSHEIFSAAKDTAAPYVPPTAEEILATQSSEVRLHRNTLLVACDWTQLPDAPVDQAAWAVYRQALRDVPDQPGFPSTVNWPEPPA